MHNNDIYTYIRSQRGNSSTPQISKQAIFSQLQITTKESLEVRLQPHNKLGMTVSKYGTLIMQSNTWRQTATNKVVVSSPVHPSGNTGHVHVKQHSNRSGRISHQDINRKIKGKQKYEHHRKYFATFILHDRLRLT